MKALPVIPAPTFVPESSQSLFIKFKLVFVAIATFAVTSGITMSALSLGLGLKYGL